MSPAGPEPIELPENLPDAADLIARIFAGPEHQAFHLAGGRPAALLVHGFPGTPSEMRALGAVFHQAGWTVAAPLLPGFGLGIPTIGGCAAEDWVNAARAELHKLQRDHFPVIVGGFSMGASISAQVAAGPHGPQGTLLLAPFVRLPGPLWSLLPVIRTLFPRVKLFRWLQPNLDDLRALQKSYGVDAGPELDDATLKEVLRNFEIPTGIFAELRRLGLATRGALARVEGRALIIQGTRDKLVSPQRTRALLTSPPARLAYLEVDAEHDLPQADKPAWPEVKAAVVAFAADIERASSSPDSSKLSPQPKADVSA